MHTSYTKIFFAFPSFPSELQETVLAGGKAAGEMSDKVKIVPWPEIDIFGNGLADAVRKSIQEADIVFCDVTVPNLNVYYELGYAVGSGKRVAPVLNNSFADAKKQLLMDGIFDGIGHKTYENSTELANILMESPSQILTELYGRPVNHRQPLFVLDAYRKTDFRNAIVSTVKASGVFFRSFDPAEVPRFSAIPIIGEASSSAGIIIPFLAPHIDDALRHNLRGAFLAGLAHGLERQTLLIQRDYTLIPADYRDNVVAIADEHDINTVVEAACKATLLATQSSSATKSKKTRSALQKLSLGASSAENEFRSLEDYFVETAEYLKTLRGEARVVAGRKGSGKTAIFFQVRDHFRKDRANFVVDLKPESHQLSLFREQLLKIADTGIFDHTLAAFWHFVLLSEALLNIQRQFEHQSTRSIEALKSALEIEEVLKNAGVFESGDFTSRLTKLGNYIVQEIQGMQKRQETLSPERLTNIVFRNGIAEIRKLIDLHTSKGKAIILLFDNIDKGWLAQGVDAFDVRMVRLLVESLDKIRHDFEAKDRTFHSVVFLRNDIYELLVGQTPDRGKAGQLRIDWTDRAKLRQVILLRLRSSTGDDAADFHELWERFFCPLVGSQSSFDYFVSHSLMRPRFLINMIESAIANGINRGHSRLSETDCKDAVKQHSLYLVNDFGYEIRDVSGLSAELLYSFVGTTKLLTRAEVIQRFTDHGMQQPDTEKAFDLMLWYGVLGIAGSDSSESFIYDFGYDIHRMRAEIVNFAEEPLYVLNSAFFVAMH